MANTDTRVAVRTALCDAVQEIVTNAEMNVMLYRWCSCLGLNSEQEMKQTGSRSTKHTRWLPPTPPLSRRHGAGAGAGCAMPKDRTAELAWLYVHQRLEDPDPGLVFDACLSCVRAARSGGDVALDFEIASFPTQSLKVSSSFLGSTILSSLIERARLSSPSSPLEFTGLLSHALQVWTVCTRSLRRDACFLLLPARPATQGV